MKRKRGLVRTILFVIVVVVVGVMYYKHFQTDKGLQVEKWDNYYDENNIKFYYQDIDSNNTEISKLIKTFKISDIVAQEKNEIGKVIKTVDILKTIVDCDDVANLNLNSGYQILDSIKERKKVSFKDMATIERDLIISAGYQARVGEFRKANSQFEKNCSYYVVEYYSTEKKQWIMIDFRDRAYIMKGDKCLSAIEILTDGLDNKTFVGNNDIKTYAKDMKDYLASYTIDIDNTFEKDKSNTVVTYANKDKTVELKKISDYIEPTIFTKSAEMFLEEPNVEIKNKDSKAYLLFMKNQTEEKKDKNYFIVTAFKDSSALKEYYVRVNNKEFEKVDKMFYDLEIKSGDNKIELSLDGEEVVSTVEINYTQK